MTTVLLILLSVLVRASSPIIRSISSLLVLPHQFQLGVFSGQQGAEVYLALFLHYCTNISPVTSG